jgi:hypothetical protein
MTANAEKPLAKWPFFLADAILVVLAFLLWREGVARFSPGFIALAAFFFVSAALLAVLPFLYEHFRKPSVQGDEEVDIVAAQIKATERALAEVSDLSNQCDRLGEEISGQAEALTQLQQQVQQVVFAQTELQKQVASQETKLRAEVEKVSRRDEEKRKELRAALDQLVQTVTLVRQNTDGLSRPPVSPRVSRSAEPQAATEAASPSQSLEVPDEPMDEPEPQESAPIAADQPAPELSEELEPDDGSEIEPEADPELEPEPAQVAAVEAQPPVDPKPRRARKPQVREEVEGLFSTSTVVATAFIGASNKLFLRGEGPGLSWEEGVPMQFVEIGKWSWSVPDHLEPVRVQVFKNDEEGDKAGVHTLLPGQRLELRPEF